MKNKMVKKYVLFIIIALAIIFSIFFASSLIATGQSKLIGSTTVEAETLSETQHEHIEYEANQEDKIDAMLTRISEGFLGVEYVSEYKEDEAYLNEEIRILEEYKDSLIRLRKNISNKYKKDIDKIIIPELFKTNNVLNKYYADRDYVNLWKCRSEEYPIATQIWLFMKKQGWNDAVCAGVMGNLMTECGGHTLNIQYWLYGGGGWFYGICQWHKGYFPEVQGQGLDFQMQYLVDTMDGQFSAFGADSLEKFLNITDPSYAAYVFALKYERCAATEWNYVSRQNNAWAAYNYFCGD